MADIWNWVLYHWPGHEEARTLLQAGQVLAATAVVIVAIWKDEIIAKVNPLRIKVRLLKKYGEREPQEDGHDHVCYHLVIENKSKGRTVQNCRVEFVRMFLRKETDTTFREISFSVPRQFHWAPSENNDRTRTFSDQAIADFCTYFSNSAHYFFKPCIRAQGGHFKGGISDGNFAIWKIAVVADNLARPFTQYYELANPQESKQSLRHLWWKDWPVLRWFGPKLD